MFLTHRFREQARSHIWFVVLAKSLRCPTITLINHAIQR